MEPCNDLAFHDFAFAFFKLSFKCKNRLLKRVFYLIIFVNRENEIFIIRDPLFFDPFLNGAKDKDTPCTIRSVCSKLTASKMTKQCMVYEHKKHNRNHKFRRKCHSSAASKNT